MTPPAVLTLSFFNDDPLLNALVDLSAVLDFLMCMASDADVDPVNDLFSELRRLRSIDGQMAGLHGVAHGYLSLHGDRPMPDAVRRALENASIDMAVGG